MECPFCGHKNMNGADQCAHCLADLTSAENSGAGSDIERSLLRTPLSQLSTRHYAIVSPDLSVRETIAQWASGSHHCAMVVDGDQLLGVFTERDVLNKIACDFEAQADKPVREFMTPNPECLDLHLPVAFGLNRMMIGDYRHIPLLDSGKLCGVVSIRDVLAFMADRVSGAQA